MIYTLAVAAATEKRGFGDFGFPFEFLFYFCSLKLRRRPPRLATWSYPRRRHVFKRVAEVLFEMRSWSFYYYYFFYFSRRKNTLSRFSHGRIGLFYKPTGAILTRLLHALNTKTRRRFIYLFFLLFFFSNIFLRI